MAASLLTLTPPLIAARSGTSQLLHSTSSSFTSSSFGRAASVWKPIPLLTLSQARRRSVPSSAIGPLVTALPATPNCRGSKRASMAARASATGSASAEGSDGSNATTRRVVEHLVYFQVKPNTPPSAVAAMVNGLRALSSAPGVLFLAVGSALPLPPALAASTPASPWTHALLGRYESRDALQAYGASAEHVKVVEGCIKPIISDILAVDWETDVNASADANASCLPFSVIHSVVMELTPPTDAVAIPTMVSSLKAHVGEIPGLTEVSIGENIAPARAKGFTWGFASYHADEAALRAYAGDERHRQVMAQTVLPLVARFNWVDFRVDEAFEETSAKL